MGERLAGFRWKGTLVVKGSPVSLYGRMFGIQVEKLMPSQPATCTLAASTRYGRTGTWSASLTFLGAYRF